MAQTEITERFLKTADQVDELEKRQGMHEVQCEERWKTCFQRLEDVERGLMRIESRMMGIGGTVILFLAGVLVTLVTKMQEIIMPSGKGTYGKRRGRPAKKGKGKKKRGKQYGNF